MPSFLEKEQITSIQPFLPDVNSILSTFNTKLDYWKQGMNSAKSAYQKYLNLDLTNEDNQQRLSKFMKTAKTQLQQAVKADMSIGDNQQITMGIFDPIVNDANIAGDNQITKFYKEQYSLGESYKNKENGKYYNANNQNVLLLKLNRFKDDLASNWKNHWSRREGYTPYYDVQSEKTELMKNFKPSVLENTSQYNVPVKDKNGNIVGYQGSMYLLHTKDQSRIASQIKLYLESNLSDKAKKQLSIDGIMAYQDRLDLLSNDYIPYGQQSISVYNNEVQKQLGILSQTKDPQEIKNINSKIDYFNNKIKDLQEDINKIDSGDLSYVNENKDKFATFLYTDKFLNQSAEGLSNKDISSELKPDEVKVEMFKESMANQRNNADNATEIQKANIAANAQIEAAKISASSKKSNSQNPNGFTFNPYNPPAGDENEVLKDKTTFENDIKQNESNLTELSNQLWRYAWNENNSQFGSDYKKLNWEGRQAAISKWLLNQSKLPIKSQDSFYQYYQTQLANLTSNKKILETTKQTIDNALINKYGAEIIRLKNDTQLLANDLNISTEEAEDLINNYIHGKLSQSKYMQSRNNSNIIGQPLYAMNSDNNTAYVERVIQKYVTDNTKAMVNEENRLYNQHFVSQENWQSINEQDSDYLNDLRIRIAGDAALPGIKKDNIGTFTTNLQGRIAFSVIPDSKEKINVKDVKENLINKGYKNVTYNERENRIYMDNPDFYLKVSSFPNEDKFNTLLNVQLKSGGHGLTPKGMFAPNGKNRYFKIDAFQNPTTGEIEYRPVIENGNKDFIMQDRKHASLYEAMKDISNITSLNDEVYNTFINNYITN